VRRMGQQRLLVGLWRAGNQRGAMTACCRSKASGHVIAQQSDACGMAAVSQRQRAAGGGGVLRIGERRLSAESDVRQIVDEFRYHPPPGGDMSKREPQMTLKTEERDICLNSGTRGNSAPTSSGWMKNRFSLRAQARGRTQERALGADPHAGWAAAGGRAGTALFRYRVRHRL